MQNSNPTLLSAADLPSREKKGAESKVRLDSIFTTESTFDPFARYQEDDDDGESSQDGSQDELEEPIDEQEIFGMPLSTPTSISNMILTRYRLDRNDIRPRAPDSAGRAGRRLAAGHQHHAGIASLAVVSPPQGHRPAYPHHHPL